MDEAQSSLRAQKKLQTQHRILDVAVRLFQEQGFDNTSFEEVAEEANVSRATVFNYFPSKRDLLHAIGIDELGKLRRMAEEDLHDVESAVTRIRLVMRQLVSDTLPYLNVTRYVIVSSMLYPSAETAATLGLGDILHQLVVEAQQRGEIRPNLSPAEVSHAISGAYLAVFLERVSHSEPVAWDDEPDVSSIVDMLFEGIAGPAYCTPPAIE
jgi:AcrR family transcriptional regulator